MYVKKGEPIHKILLRLIVTVSRSTKIVVRGATLEDSSRLKYLVISLWCKRYEGHSRFPTFPVVFVLEVPPPYYWWTFFYHLFFVRNRYVSSTARTKLLEGIPDDGVWKEYHSRKVLVRNPWSLFLPWLWSLGKLISQQQKVEPWHLLLKMYSFKESSHSFDRCRIFIFNY